MENNSKGINYGQPQGEAPACNLGWLWIRTWGRRLTFGLSLLTVILATPNFMFMLSHARVDSEVGVMVNGMMTIMTVMTMTPAVACALLLWIVGIYLDRRVSAHVPWWEYAVCVVYLIGVVIIARPFIARLL